MKKIISLSFIAAGLFFAVDAQAQETNSNASLSTSNVKEAKAEMVNARLAELDKQEAELKASGIKGDALQARLDIINNQRIQLQNQSNSNNAKSAAQSATAKD